MIQLMEQLFPRPTDRGEEGLNQNHPLNIQLF